MIRKRVEVKPVTFENCHDGVGALDCYSMLVNGDSELGFTLFHYDVIPPGATIGEHTHTDNEEIYFLVSGSCRLIYDGKETDMDAGDFSLVKRGHSHGLVNNGDADAVLVVVGVDK